MSLSHNIDISPEDNAVDDLSIDNQITSSSLYTSLLAKIFPVQSDSLTQPPKVIALIGAHPGSGVTHVCNACSSILNDRKSSTYKEYRSIRVDYRRLTEFWTDLRSIVTTETGPELLYQRTSTGATIYSLLHGTAGTWHTDARYRSKCILTLKSIFTYAFIDCPSLKERADFSLLAPLVDGVVIVVEANRTTHRQLSYLVRTIEDMGGTVLGLVLNKRTYPIPERIYEKLTTSGIV